MILKGGWARYGTRCHGGDGATELGLVLAAVVGPLCGSSPGTVWSSRESGQRPLLWGVSGSQESYCVARLTTAAARRARSDALAPLYSPRISCPPRPPVFGLSRADRRAGMPPRARVRTPPGLLLAFTGTPRRAVVKPRPRPRRCPPAGLDPHPASPQTARLLQADGGSPGPARVQGEPCARRPRVAAGLGPPPASPQAARPVRADRRPAAQVRARPRVLRFESARRRTVWCRLRARGLCSFGARRPAGRF